MSMQQQILNIPSKLITSNDVIVSRNTLKKVLNVYFAEYVMQLAPHRLSITKFTLLVGDMEYVYKLNCMSSTTLGYSITVTGENNPLCMISPNGRIEFFSPLGVQSMTICNMIYEKFIRQCIKS